MVAIPEASAVSISLWFSVIRPVLDLVACSSIVLTAIGGFRLASLAFGKLWVRVFLELEVPFKLLIECVMQPVGLASTSERVFNSKKFNKAMTSKSKETLKQTESSWAMNFNLIHPQISTLEWQMELFS